MELSGVNSGSKIQPGKVGLMAYLLSFSLKRVLTFYYLCAIQKWNLRNRPSAEMRCKEWVLNLMGKKCDKEILGIVFSKIKSQWKDIESPKLRLIFFLS